MPLVEILFNQLQNREIDPSLAQKANFHLQTNIRRIRDQLDDSSETTNNTNTVSKRRKTERMEWTREAKEVCDVITCEANSRFTFTCHVMAATLFTPEKFPSCFWNFPKQTVEKLCPIYTFLDKGKLSHHELSSIYSAEELRSMSGAVGVLDFIVQNSLEKMFNESSI